MKYFLVCWACRILMGFKTQKAAGRVADFHKMSAGHRSVNMIEIFSKDQIDPDFEANND
jgi:hypothetical protein